MVVNYLMILVLLVTLTLHIAMQGFLPGPSYESALTYSVALERYKAPLSVALLTTLLIAATYHGLWGLRNILLELRSGPRWNKAVAAIVLVLGGVMLIWGARTIVVAFGGL